MIQRGRPYRVLRELLCGTVRFLVGAYPSGDMPPAHRQTLYFANHTSHLDTLVILAALKLRARSRVRPVAARDYWCKTARRRWVAEWILNVVFIDRQRSNDGDPLQPVRQALEEGASLIFFPEGTRGDQALPGSFKSGLFRLAQDFPALSLAPVYLENLHRILPKGALLPLPLINKVHFGPVLARVDDETKEEFLERAHRAVSQLAPGH